METTNLINALKQIVANKKLQRYDDWDGCIRYITVTAANLEITPEGMVVNIKGNHRDWDSQIEGEYQFTIDQFTELWENKSINTYYEIDHCRIRKSYHLPK